MEAIKNLLKRYSDITPPHESIRIAVCAAVENVCGILIDIKNVSYKNNTVYISTNPPLRSAIFTHKQQILSAIQDTLGVYIKDIK